MAKATEALRNIILSYLPGKNQGWYISTGDLGDKLSKVIPGSKASRTASIHHCLLSLEKLGYVERHNSTPIGWRRTQAGTEYLDRINGWVR